MNYKTLITVIVTACLASYVSQVDASPIIRKPIYPVRKSNELGLDIDELVKFDVKELCTRIKKRDTLWKIFRSGKPLISNIFPGSHIPNMCHGIHVAMRNGWTGIVDQYAKHNRCKFNIFDLQELAISGSHLNYFKRNLEMRAFKKKYDVGDLYRIFFDYAASNGELNLLQSSLHNVYGTPSAMNMAASNGHLNIVQWLHDEKRMVDSWDKISGCSRDAMAFAARHDQLSIVEYLFTNCFDESDIGSAISLAFCKKSTKVMKYLTAKLKGFEIIPSNGKARTLIFVVKILTI
jgi:hypothetical protein